MKRNSAIYDVCVVGTGAAGGVVAIRLARRGASVVALEAGRWVDPAKDFYSHTMPYEAPKNGFGWDPRRHLRVDPDLRPCLQPLMNTNGESSRSRRDWRSFVFISG